jgi:hypothetical protein
MVQAVSQTGLEISRPGDPRGRPGTASPRALGISLSKLQDVLDRNMAFDEVTGHLRGVHRFQFRRHVEPALQARHVGGQGFGHAYFEAGLAQVVGPVDAGQAGAGGIDHDRRQAGAPRRRAANCPDASSSARDGAKRAQHGLPGLQSFSSQSETTPANSSARTLRAMLSTSRPALVLSEGSAPASSRGVACLVRVAKGRHVQRRHAFAVARIDVGARRDQARNGPPSSFSAA